ncbi:hypothetical protein ES963_04245 [Bacillus subtilis]|nr:hypothetical protein ES963_04245 [Bacillus subtilis]QAW56247.1 hypothetical protein ETL60_04255 [Bacillus subtilis]QGI37134.1 hypothetical protein GII86_04405 [Bacillus subtilis]
MKASGYNVQRGVCPLADFFPRHTAEALREEGVRLPKTVGQTVGILGALVIGTVLMRKLCLPHGDDCIYTWLSGRFLSIRAIGCTTILHHNDGNPKGRDDQV